MAFAPAIRPCLLACVPSSDVHRASRHAVPRLGTVAGGVRRRRGRRSAGGRRPRPRRSVRSRSRPPSPARPRASRRSPSRRGLRRSSLRRHARRAARRRRPAGSPRPWSRRATRTPMLSAASWTWAAMSASLTSASPVTDRGRCLVPVAQQKHPLFQAISLAARAPQAILQCRFVTYPAVNPSPGTSPGQGLRHPPAVATMNKRMAAKNKNTRLKSNMTIAFYPATDRGRSAWFPSPQGLHWYGLENQKWKTTWMFTSSSSRCWQSLSSWACAVSLGAHRERTAIPGQRLHLSPRHDRSRFRRGELRCL